MGLDIKKQFERLPLPEGFDGSEVEGEAIRASGLAYLDDFWSSVEARLIAHLQHGGPQLSRNH
jgi:hypothetical protein